MKCCDITAGMLRTPVELQAISKTPDAAGNLSITWDTYATVRGHVRPISGTERVMAERIDAITRVRAVIRYNPAVKEGDRAIIDGRAHQIRAALNLEYRNKWLELHLEAGVAT